MKIQQSAAPYLCILAILLIGIPLTEKRLNDKAQKDVVEIEVQPYHPNIVQLDEKEVKEMNERN